MRYFCSYSYLQSDNPRFGSCVLETPVDPYDDIERFMDKLEELIDEPRVILLFYKKVKS